MRAKAAVEVRFAHVGAVAVDGSQGCGVVDGERVGGKAHHGAVVGVETVEVDVFVSAMGVVDVVPFCEAAEEGAGVGGEGMEVDAVEG